MICLGVVFFSLEFIEDLGSLGLQFSSNLENFWPWFLQTFFCLFSLLSSWDFHYICVRQWGIVSQSTDVLFIFIQSVLSFILLASIQVHCLQGHLTFLWWLIFCSSHALLTFLSLEVPFYFVSSIYLFPSCSRFSLFLYLLNTWSVFITIVFKSP